MKKILFLILSFALFTACSKDNENLNPINGEEMDVTITAEVPALLSTKALSSINSAKGGVNNVDPDTHKLRYILEITDPTGVTAPRQVQAVSISGISKASFTVRLVKGATYKFVAWADFTLIATPEADNHYITTNLTAIKLKDLSAQIVNDDSKDAYFASESKAVSSTIKITLKRPFGKVRFIATDYGQFAGAGSILNSVTQTYTTTDQYNEFDATTGTVGNTKITTFIDIPATILTVPDESNIANEKTLYWDYLFAPATGAKVAFNLKSSISPGAVISTFVTSSVGATAERNKLTTIRQAIFSQNSIINLEISDDFDGNSDLPTGTGPFSIGSKYYATITDALAEVLAGETINVGGGTFAGDFTIPSGVTVEGRAKATVFEGRITLAAGATLKNAKSFFNDPLVRTAIVISGNNAVLEGVIFNTESTRKNPEAIVTNANVIGLKVINCVFNEDATSKYWKGLFLNSADGVEITGCTFNKLNPFSTEEYVNTLVVTGNTFNRFSLIGNTQMIHLVSTTTTNVADITTYEAGLEAAVIQIKKSNIWNDTTSSTKRFSVRVNNMYVHGEDTWVFQAI